MLASLPVPAPLALPGLRRLAWIVRALIAIGAVVLAGVMVWTWISPERATAQLRSVSMVCDATPAAADIQALGAAWSVVPLSLSLLALQRLWVLFGEYGQGRVFSRRALLTLRGFARCVLALGLLSPVYGAVMSIIATLHRAPGHRQLNVAFDSNDYALLLFGAVLLAISSVMAEAARVAEDNAGFV